MTPTADDLVVTRWGARFRGRRLPCAIGRGGISGTKREGDGATPRGVHRIVGGRFRADRPLLLRIEKAPIGAKPIGPRDIWSDDPNDPHYNHGRVASAYGFSHEKMRRGDGMYDLVLITDYNRPNAKPGGGSAIFVHCWRAPRHPTAGCVAFKPSDLAWIVSRWRPWSRMVVHS